MIKRLLIDFGFVWFIRIEINISTLYNILLYSVKVYAIIRAFMILHNQLLIKLSYETLTLDLQTYHIK